MKRSRLVVAAAGALLAASTVACGALLGFPDETNADPTFGQTDGAGGPDVTLPDGGELDGSPDSPFPLDAPIVSPDGGCNCFGGTCDGGVCQPVVIVSGKSDPNFIDTDDTTVFFASGGTTILAVNPNDVDAGVRTITNLLEPSINDLRARSGYVYFTNFAGGNLNSVSRCSSAGCAGDRTEYGVSTRKNFRVAVDGANVYFTVQDSKGAGGGVWRRSQTGDAGATLLQGRDYPGSIATNGTHVAWAEGASNTGLMQCLTGGGAVDAGVEQAIVDLTYGAGTEAFFVKSSSLWHQSGAQGPTQIGGGPQVTNAVAVRADASYVYWLNGDPSSGALMRCPVGANCLTSTNQVTTLASGLQNPFGLALGSDSIYFTTRNDNKVWRLRK